MFWKYLVYVLRHKWYVFLAGRQLDVPLWRLLVHDWSKFLPSEFGPYARRFFSGRSGILDKSADPEEFQRAWTHHWHLNAHHWEHWLTSEGIALTMPGDLVREMVADWCGAGRAITGKWDVHVWYMENGKRMILHPNVRQFVDRLVPSFVSPT